MLTYGLVGSGAALGAAMRFLITNLFKKMELVKFSLATLCINLIGCLLMGILLGLKIQGAWWSFLGLGILGGFTTFSTWMSEVAALMDTKRIKVGLIYLLGTFMGGWFLILVGRYVIEWFIQ